jgi:hypothetical protein
MLINKITYIWYFTLHQKYEVDIFINITQYQLTKYYFTLKIQIRFVFTQYRLYNIMYNVV